VELGLLMACGQRYREPMTLIEEARRMAPSLSRGTSFVYILQLQSGVFYVGCSNDAEARFAKHADRTACYTTAVNPPVAVLYIEIHPDFATAREREAQIKKWSRAKKEALMAGDISRLKALSRSRD
jgi:putative endonuclease